MSEISMTELVEWGESVLIGRKSKEDPFAYLVDVAHASDKPVAEIIKKAIETNWVIDYILTKIHE